MSNILIVEDHADTARALQILLHRHGYNVTLARSAEDAKALCKTQSFDLMICDVTLPGEDGWSLMRHLRRECPVRAIALSGRAFPSDKQASADAGFVAHVTKPVDMSDLLEAVQKALETSGPGE